MEDWKDCSAEVITAKSDIAMDIQRYADHCLKIGFTLEGCMRQESETDDDMLIFGMLKSECRWLNG